MDQEIAELYQKVRCARGAQKNQMKQRLLQLLKRRKMYSNQMGNYIRNQNVIDNMAFTHENIQNTMEMAEAMKQSNEAHQQMMKGINIDKLEDMRDDMQDMMWEAQ